MLRPASPDSRDMAGPRRAATAPPAPGSQFAGAFEDAPIAMALVDTDGRLLLGNEALGAFLHDRDATRPGMLAVSILHPDDLEAYLPLLRRLARGEERTVRFEARARGGAGDAPRWGQVTVSAVGDGRGGSLRYLAQVVDVTARRAGEQLLADYTGAVRSRTRQDRATGLAGRPEFDAEVRRRQAGPEPCMLLLLTAATQRGASDHAGRETPGRTLRQVADQVAETCRSTDGLFRVGPATLALMAPGMGTQDADRAASRIRRQVQARTPDVTLGIEIVELGGADGRLGALLARDGSPAPATGAPGGALRPAAAEGIRGMLATARRHLGMDVAWLSEFTDGQQVFRALAGDADSFGLSEGAGLPLSGSFCVRVLDGRLPAAIPDTAANAVTRELEITADAGIGSYAGAAVRLADGRVYGMLCAAGHAARPRLDERDARSLELLADLVAERIDHELRQWTRRRLEVEDAGVTALLAALEARDHYTGDHSEAVVALSGAVARVLGLPDTAVHEVERVGLLHDIGKVGIPDSVLHKPGPLNALEWELMREHSALGGRIVGSIESLAHLAPAVRAEHERWDGAGYPDGLAGEAIPIASRIILAADAYHAMTSDRPYRAAMAAGDAVRELRRCAGTQFDPAVVDALVAVVSGRSAPPGRLRAS